jgi:thymidylate synthase
VHTGTIGKAWLEVAERILTSGRPGQWDGLPMRELLGVTLEIDSPAADDPIIARHADPERLAWMHANFTDHEQVAALGDADSYATRLYDYARSGRDQIAWVVERLRRDPYVRDATITTFQPLTDTSYVPCVSLLDFWLEDGRLQLGVYAHGIDFGTKGYANLVELAAIQRPVAVEVGAAVGTLTMTVKSAHVYDTELELMRGILDAS